MGRVVTISTQELHAMLISVTGINDHQFLFSHQTLPSKLKMQKGNQENPLWPNVARRSWGGKQIPLSLPPTPQAALEQASRTSACKPHIGSICYSSDLLNISSFLLMLGLRKYFYREFVIHDSQHKYEFH